MRKNYIGLVILVGMFLLLTACQSNTSQNASQDSKLTEEAPIQERPSSKNGLTVETEKKEYTTSPEKIVLHVYNEGEKPYTRGPLLFLEKEVNGTWYVFPYNREGIRAIGLDLSPGNSTQLELSVSDLKYNLTPGEYRLVFADIASPFTVVE